MGDLQQPRRLCNNSDRDLVEKALLRLCRKKFLVALDENFRIKVKTNLIWVRSQARLFQVMRSLLDAIVAASLLLSVQVCEHVFEDFSILQIFHSGLYQYATCGCLRF